MPESRTFIVTQTREIEVTANTCADAADIADHAFRGETPGEDVTWGHTRGSIREIDLHVKERRYGR